jgi:hypothetical protein
MIINDINENTTRDRVGERDATSFATVCSKFLATAVLVLILVIGIGHDAKASAVFTRGALGEGQHPAQSCRANALSPVQIAQISDAIQFGRATSDIFVFGFCQGDCIRYIGKAVSDPTCHIKSDVDFGNWRGWEWKEFVCFYQEKSNTKFREGGLGCAIVNAFGGGNEGTLWPNFVGEPHMLDSDSGAMRGQKFMSLGGGSIPSRKGGDLSVSQALSHVMQLNPEEDDLAHGRAKQGKSESRQPKRIISDPLRFESKFSIYFSLLPPVLLLVLGLGFGVLAGENFYRERRVIGAALLGCGWLCGLIAWGLTAGRWFL